MRSRRFEPTVRRNRVVTNWVVASHSQQQQTRPKRRLIWLVPAFAAPLLIFAFVSLWQQNLPRNSSHTASGSTLAVSGSATSPSPLRSVISTTRCSDADIATRLESLQKVSVVTLGGVRDSEVSCGEPAQIFLVSEALVDEKWQLKKISRPPEGNREISVEY